MSSGKLLTDGDHVMSLASFIFFSMSLLLHLTYTIPGGFASKRKCYYYYYYLSDLSRDWVAPKGIACTRVLPTTQIQNYLYNRHSKQSKKEQITKQKQITGNHKKKN